MFWYLTTIITQNLSFLFSFCVVGFTSKTSTEEKSWSHTKQKEENKKLCIENWKMVHYPRYHQLKKGEQQRIDEDDALVLMFANPGFYKRTRPKFLSLLLLSLLSCCLILAPHFFFSSTAFSHLCKPLSLCLSLCSSLFFWLFSFLFYFICAFSYTLLCFLKFFFVDMS